MHAVQIEINRGLYLDELTLRADGRASTSCSGICRALAAPLFNDLPALLERRAAAE